MQVDAPPGSQSHNELLLWAAATICFFGFFHAGEVTVVGSLVRPGDPFGLGRRGNQLQSASGAGVPQAVEDGPVQPGERRYSWAPRGMSCAQCRRPGPMWPGGVRHQFFCGEDGSSLMKSRFVKMVWTRLVRVGISHTGYSGHSFRIGAVTTAAQAGIPDSAIPALGKWSSSVFLRYICPPREELAQYSAPLAQRL